MRDAAFWMAQVRDPRILVSVLWNVFAVVALDVLTSHCLVLMYLLSAGTGASFLFWAKGSQLICELCAR